MQEFAVQGSATCITLRFCADVGQEIAFFSYDDEHKFHLDSSSLRYYYPPILPADLNHGFDTFRKHDDTVDEHLSGLLDTLAAHEQRRGTKTEADIVTWRGMMTKVCWFHSVN